MATTSPDNLYSPDTVNPYNLTVDLAAMQTSVQAALKNRPTTYRVLTDAQRLALTGGDLFEGLTVRTSDTRREWLYTGSTWVGADPGIFLNYPSSVGSATLAANGTVTPQNGAATFRMNGIFSPRFRSYDVEFSLSMSTPSAGIGLQLLSGGTVNVTNSYVSQRMVASGSSISATSSTATSWAGTGVAGSILSGRWKFRNVATSGAVKTYSAESSQAPGTGYAQESGFLSGADAAIYDGLQIAASTGAFTGGFVKVYGWA